MSEWLARLTAAVVRRPWPSSYFTVPSGPTTTAELFDMFCALNGATLTPRRYSHRQIPAVSTLLPASEVVPATSSPPPRVMIRPVA